MWFLIWTRRSPEQNCRLAAKLWEGTTICACRTLASQCVILPGNKLRREPSTVECAIKCQTLFPNRKFFCPANRVVVREILAFWERARIPTQEEKHCVTKVENLVSEWKTLRKLHFARLTDAQKQKEDRFRSSLNDLFDIAHSRALDLIENEEDRQFLLSQRKEGRPGAMLGVDRALAVREARSAARAEAVESRRARHQAEVARLHQSVCLETSSSSSSKESSGHASPPNE